MKQVITSAAAVVALVISIGTGYGHFNNRLEEMDERHVQVSDYQDFQWGIMKEQLRKLRKAIAQNPSDLGLQEDYGVLLDTFCRKYPDDRECK